MCNDMSLRFRRQQFFYKIFEGIPLPTVVKPSTFQAQRWVLSMTLSSPLGKMGPTKTVTVASSSSLERDLTVKGSRGKSAPGDFERNPFAFDLCYSGTSKFQSNHLQISQWLACSQATIVVGFFSFSRGTQPSAQLSPTPLKGLKNSK